MSGQGWLAKGGWLVLGVLVCPALAQVAGPVGEEPEHVASGVAGDAGCVEEAKLVAADGAEDDRFGWSVSVYGDRVLVGAFLADENGPDSGAAYVFRRVGGTWVEEAKLVASDGAAGAQFGSSVSLFGDTAVVGAFLDDGSQVDSGSAYVFRWDGSGWVEEAKLAPVRLSREAHFGAAVSVFEDTVVVGAPNDRADLWDEGTAYVFRRIGGVWVEEAKLASGDVRRPGDRFGASVSVWQDVLAVGVPGAGISDGRVEVFRWNGERWRFEQSIWHEPGTDVGDGFGHSVAVFRDTMLVGVPWGDAAGRNRGGASVFRWDGSTWVFERSLLPGRTIPSGAQFGYSVALWHDTAVVGAPGVDEGGFYSGAVLVFRWDGLGWMERDRFLGPEGVAGAGLGFSVGLQAGGELVVAGARGDRGMVSRTGAAYVVSCPRLRGDFDGDGDVDISDFTVFAGCFTGSGTPCSGECCLADFDGDGDVDIADFNTFAGDFGG